MNDRDLIHRLRAPYARPAGFFFSRPHLARRRFLRTLAGGLTASTFAGKLHAGEPAASLSATPISKARQVIFILLSGAPSHVDTFDFKTTPDSPLSLLQPETVSGIVFPAGLMPKLAAQLGDLAIVRSALSWALQHNLAQAWAQIGRNPAAVLGDIAPNAGSIVAIEKEKERKPSDVFPTFLGLNAGDMIGPGYLSSQYAPLKINPATTGLPDTSHPDGQARFESKFALLDTLDAPLRSNSPVSPEFEDYAAFYRSGRNMMFNPTVDAAFRFTQEESARYGASGFGNACLVAHKVVRANAGTRYIQINFGGWDHHQDIYAATALPAFARSLDNGLSQLVADLKTSGLFNETLIVMMGEFGRTPGPITAQNGRDHFLQHFIVFAGAGIRGGRAIGATNSEGSAAAEFGWSGNRYVRPEDVEATIYSALGINWTTIRYDDPFGRGFEYVYGANDGRHGPIHDLWT